jgi:hypothetical protein
MATSPSNIFTGDTALAAVSAYVAAPITFLLGNDFEPVGSPA